MDDKLIASFTASHSKFPGRDVYLAEHNGDKCIYISDVGHFSMRAFGDLLLVDSVELVWADNLERDLILGVDAISESVVNRCPHCGAPVDALNDSECDSCGTILHFLSVEKGEELMGNLYDDRQENFQLRCDLLKHENSKVDRETADVVRRARVRTFIIAAVIVLLLIEAIRRGLITL